MPSNRHLIFAYGSLKRGFSNVHFLKGQTFLREATTRPVYRMFDYGGYPGLVPDSENGYAIHGELWEINDECLVGVDYLEGVEEGLYTRETAELAPPDEHLEGVILYHYARETVDLPDVGGRWEKAWDGQC